MEMLQCSRALPVSLPRHLSNMSSFANSPDLFASTCATLFAKMLDTVPSGVQLTDVIRALPVKPDNVQLALDGDTLRLSGQLRVCINPVSASSQF
jgi:hypothetical protein